MSNNRAVTYQGPMKVSVDEIDYPTFELKDGPGVNPANVGRKVPHGAILKVVTTNICGSDQHMGLAQMGSPSSGRCGGDGSTAVRHCDRSEGAGGTARRRSSGPAVGHHRFRVRGRSQPPAGGDRRREPR